MKKLKLRSEHRNDLTSIVVNVMLRYYRFYDCYENRNGKGIQHVFEKQVLGEVIHDHTTGLTWQRGGSLNAMVFKDAQTYVSNLNTDRFAGYDDWRLPTLEEAMSLMEPKKNGNLYIDSVFDARQVWIWTADKDAAGRVWVVDFGIGGCGYGSVINLNYVRAVSSKKD